MGYLIEDFINVFLLVFGLSLALAGIFTVYFGAGKSRKLGAIILVAGLGIVGLMYWLFTAGYTGPGTVSFWDYVKGPVVTLFAGITGVVAAVLLFIGIITKA